jgi:hypothetical protein
LDRSILMANTIKNTKQTQTHLIIGSSKRIKDIPQIIYMHFNSKLIRQDMRLYVYSCFQIHFQNINRSDLKVIYLDFLHLVNLAILFMEIFIIFDKDMRINMTI